MFFKNFIFKKNQYFLPLYHLNTGVKNIPEAYMLYEKLKYRWGEASINLAKWRTNDEKLREVIYIKEDRNRENRCNQFRDKGGMSIAIPCL